jgi:hypothetical protein
MPAGLKTFSLRCEAQGTNEPDLATGTTTHIDYCRINDISYSDTISSTRTPGLRKCPPLPTSSKEDNDNVVTSVHPNDADEMFIDE